MPSLEELLPTLLLVAWLAPLASFVVSALAGSMLSRKGYVDSAAARTIGHVATGAIGVSLISSVLALGGWISAHPLGDGHGEPAAPLVGEWFGILDVGSLHVGIGDRPNPQHRALLPRFARPRVRLLGARLLRTRLLRTRLGARLGLDALVSGGARALPDSLPDGMPFYSSLLWGEHGLVRAVGLAPSTRRGELVLRRSMLQWHQRMGLATLGVMTAQVILGELIAADRVEHSDLIPTHRTLGYVTFGMYLGTASLSLGAPPARRYGGGFSNVQLHRYLALVHFTGMMVQPWLGAHLADAESLESYDARLTTHRWVGRVTYAAFGAAVLSIFFGF